MAHRVSKAKQGPPDPEVVEDIDDDAEHDQDETTAEEILEQARDRLKLCFEVWKSQKDREREDLQFQIPEMQWTDEARAQRAGGGNTPARPMLSVSLVDQPLALLNNQMRSADLGCQFHPVSEKANSDTAEAFQGLYRFDERRSRGEIARAWAFNRATKAGMGYYRLLTEYDDEGGDPGDQRIVFQRILYQEGVYLDPTAAAPDFRDGEYAFVLSWMPFHEFKRRWPESQTANAGQLDMEAYAGRAPEWVRENPGGKGRDVLVGEYWYKVKRFEQFEVGDGEEREREVWDVYCAKTNGWELLEDPYKWPGKWIPIIPVIGQELQQFDEKRRWVGLIFPAKGAQRIFNYAISAAAERVSLEPKAPFVAQAEAIEGYEQEWDQANLKNYSVLRYNSYSKIRPDQQLQKPERAEISTQGVSLALELAQMGRDGVQSATMLFDPSLGRTKPDQQSGRAILAVQQQGDVATNFYLQNLVDISMTYEAEIYMDLARKIYTRPGRVMRIVMGDDKKVKAAMFNAPHVIDPQTKMPQPAKPGQPGAKMYDLSVGHYGVSFTIGQNYQTRLQEGSETLSELMSKMPALTVVIGDIWARFQQGKPGFQEIADRLAKWREMQMPGLSDSEAGGQPTIEQLQGALKRGEQQTQMMGQQMQAMQHALETEQAKQQAQMMKAQLDAQIKIQELQAEMTRAMREDETKRVIAAADNETKLLIADLANQMKVMLETLGLRKEAMIAERQAENDERDREHQVGMARMTQEHDARKTAAGHAVQMGEAERGREFDAESADRQREYDESQAQANREHEAALSMMNRPEPEAE